MFLCFRECSIMRNCLRSWESRRGELWYCHVCRQRSILPPFAAKKIPGFGVTFLSRQTLHAADVKRSVNIPFLARMPFVLAGKHFSGLKKVFPPGKKLSWRELTTRPPIDSYYFFCQKRDTFPILYQSLRVSTWPPAANQRTKGLGTSSQKRRTTDLEYGPT